jgi:surfactin synthase thioesterase subunit
MKLFYESWWWKIVYNFVHNIHGSAIGILEVFNSLSTINPQTSVDSRNLVRQLEVMLWCPHELLHQRERVRDMLPMLSDELLLDAYRNAIRLGLEREFVRMLRSEIGRRRLTLPEGRAI